MITNFKRSFLVLWVLFLIAGCAKETSKEERKREESERQYRRMQKAEGHYSGYVAIKDTQLVPLSLDLTANRNPQGDGDNPTLSASVRVGMFGGVVLSSNAVSFDWGNGRFSINLSKVKAAPDAAAPGLAPLEIRGILSDSVVSEGVIDGPISGNHGIVLAKNGPNLFAEQDHYNYQAEITDAVSQAPVSTPALLSLKRLAIQHGSTSISDLPTLPAFDASIRFADLGIVPQTATDVLYDPILGFIEFTFGATLLRVNDVYLNRDSLAMSLAEWKPATIYTGVIVHGAAVYGHVKLSDFPGLGLADSAARVTDLPPRYFVGTYKGPLSPKPVKAIASLEYQNTQGTNSAEYPFQLFPKLTLKYVQCMDNHAFGEATFNLTALDQVRSLARFQDAMYPARSLDMSFTAGWQSLAGKVKSESSGSIDPRDPQLLLRPANLAVFDCSATKIESNP